MSLTVFEKKHYLATGGLHCPFCGGDQLEGSFVEIIEHGAEQRLACLDCHRSWRDIHHLVDVVADDDAATTEGESQ